MYEWYVHDCFTNLSNRFTYSKPLFIQVFMGLYKYLPNIMYRTRKL